MVKCFNPNVIAVGRSLKAANSCFLKPELQANGVKIRCRRCATANACFVFFPGCQWNIDDCMDKMDGGTVTHCELWSATGSEAQTKMILHLSSWPILKRENSLNGWVGSVQGGEQWPSRAEFSPSPINYQWNFGFLNFGRTDCQAYLVFLQPDLAAPAGQTVECKCLVWMPRPSFHTVKTFNAVHKRGFVCLFCFFFFDRKETMGLQQVWKWMTLDFWKKKAKNLKTSD